MDGRLGLTEKMRILIITLVLLNLGFLSKPKEEKTYEFPYLGGKASLFLESLGEPDFEEKGLLGVTTRYIWGDNETNYTSITKDITGKVICVSIMRLQHFDDIESIDWMKIRIDALTYGTVYDKSKPEDWQLIERRKEKVDATWVSERTGSIVDILLTKKEEDSLAGFLTILRTPDVN